MRCPRCGTELERPGQGHTCRSVHEVPPEPPTGWVVAAWLALAFAGLYVLSALAVAAVVFAQTDPSVRLSVPFLLSSLLWVGSVVGTVVTQVFWNRETRRVADLYGADASRYTRYWFYRVHGMAALLTVCLQAGPGASARGLLVAGTAIRVTGGLLLIAGVLIGRSRVLALITDSAAQSNAAQHRTAAAYVPPPPAIPQPFAARPPEEPVLAPPGPAAGTRPDPLPGAEPWPQPDPWPESEPWPESDPWPDPDAPAGPASPAPAPPRSRRPRPSSALTPLPGDWDAHQWDPETQRDIVRRRRDPAP